MRSQKTFDWFEAMRGNKYYLPQSHGQGVQLVQQVLVPLQAQIALVSGKGAGDLAALNFYSQTDVITCEDCQQALTRAGSGHDTACELFQRVQQVVLMTDENSCEKSLLLNERDKLEARLNRLDKQLARVDAKKSQ